MEKLKELKSEVYKKIIETFIKKNFIVDKEDYTITLTDEQCLIEINFIEHS